MRQALSDREREILRMPDGRWLRPHLLFFDEYYEEHLFRSGTAMQRAAQADALLVIGTSGATTLPNLIVRGALERQRPVLVIGPEETVFSEAARQYGPGGLVLGTACEQVPPLVDRIRQAMT
jgi:NAD-dependent deacetylase